MTGVCELWRLCLKPVAVFCSNTGEVMTTRRVSPPLPLFFYIYFFFWGIFTSPILKHDKRIIRNWLQTLLLPQEASFAVPKLKHTCGTQICQWLSDLKNVTKTEGKTNKQCLSYWTEWSQIHQVRKERHLHYSQCYNQLIWMMPSEFEVILIKEVIWFGGWMEFWKKKKKTIRIAGSAMNWYFDWLCSQVWKYYFMPSEGS